jgi:hypothetical protein
VPAQPPSCLLLDPCHGCGCDPFTDVCICEGRQSADGQLPFLPAQHSTGFVAVGGVPLSSLRMADQLMVVVTRRVEGGVVSSGRDMKAAWKEDELKQHLVDNNMTRLRPERVDAAEVELYCLADGLAMPDVDGADASLFHPSFQVGGVRMWRRLVGNITLARNAALAPQADVVLLVHVMSPGACAVWPAWTCRLG